MIRDFWHLANNISNNFGFHLSLLCINQMAPQLSFLPLKLNPSFKSLLPTLLWIILGICLLLLHPLTTSSLNLKFFNMTFSRHSLTLILGGLRSGWSLSCCSQKLSFRSRSLPSETFFCLSTSTYPSCWRFGHIQPVPKMVTAQILLTTAL